jgi:hypothetical protein
MACRRGFVKVASSFLIHEANVPVCVRDDYGRTILHDAAWTYEPNFELIELILKGCPDLLFMSDRTGHMAISYARKSHWGAWNKFLKQNSDLRGTQSGVDTPTPLGSFGHSNYLQREIPQ